MVCSEPTRLARGWRRTARSGVSSCQGLRKEVSIVESETLWFHVSFCCSRIGLSEEVSNEEAQPIFQEGERSECKETQLVNL